MLSLSISLPLARRDSSRAGVQPVETVRVSSKPEKKKSQAMKTINKRVLAVFPGGDHFPLFTSPDRVLSPIAAFLDAPMPKAR